jgi:predicted 3-demethylubiquinone-9 3-methyltransferase (glyoxalase superfamily)
VDIRVGGYFAEPQRVVVYQDYQRQIRAGHCPPGLAKKGNGCLPPGQAKKMYVVGRPLPPGVVYYDLPPQVEWFTLQAYPDHTLPVVIEDVDEKMALQILHQANNHHGSWVQQKLAEAIKDAESLGIAVTDLGYTKEEYDKILAEAMAMADKANSETEDLDEEGVAGFSEKFMIVIECKDEDEQQELFSEFQDRGLNSRLMK